jgi:hypothetical protein
MTATAIISRETQIRTTKTMVNITTTKVATPNKHTTKEAVMDIMMSRALPGAR